MVRLQFDKNLQEQTAGSQSLFHKAFVLWMFFVLYKELLVKGSKSFFAYKTITYLCLDISLNKFKGEEFPCGLTSCMFWFSEILTNQLVSKK